jgi:DNA-binding Lrp family transcriptional regulator
LKVSKLRTDLDDVDTQLIGGMRRDPHASVAELSRTLGIARATVQSRINALWKRGVLTGYGPDIHGPSVGLGVSAFTTLEIAQGSLVSTVAALTRLPEVLEVHTVTGPGDLLIRLVARSNDHLNDILQEVVAIETVVRSQTHLALSTQLSRTVADLIAVEEKPAKPENNKRT